MRTKLAFAALLLPFIASPAMAQTTSGALFPPANEQTCLSSAGLPGLLTWTGQRLECRPFRIPLCPTNQVILGVVDGVVKCGAVSPMVSLGSCAGKKIVRGIENGKLVCADNMVAATCPSGQFVTGFTADGGVTCASPSQPTISSCAQGQVVIGTAADGKPVCGTQGDGTTGGTPTTNPNAATLVSCLGSYCSGANNIIFPGRNGAGAKSEMPVRCRGNWWADVRGPRWDSSCSTGFETMTTCTDDNGRAIANCPDQTAAPATTLMVSCTDFVCKGVNSQVTFSNTTLNKKAVVSCKGEWTANVRDQNWTSTCATGWEKVAGYTDPAPGSAATTVAKEPVPCINATCSGNDDVVFPVRNAVGGINPYPYYCKGAWTSEVRGANWNGSCSGTQVELKDCVDPRTKQKIANCPDVTPPPAQTQSATCMYQVCKGRNTRVTGSNAAGRAETATCLGEWTADLRGSNWSSTCSTQWVDLQSQASTATPTPTPTATATAGAEGKACSTPTISWTAVGNTDVSCSGQVGTVASGAKLRVTSLAGESAGYAVIACNNGSLSVTSDRACKSPETAASPTPTATPTPAATPAPALTRISGCIDNRCEGTDAIIFPVRNAVGGINKYPYYCKGAWTSDVRGPRWLGSCSTGAVELTSCVDPVTKLKIPNCPDMTPPPAQTLNANCYGICKGRNTRVTGVNAEGKGAIATCKGEWTADVSGKNWVSSCSTGWQEQAY